MVNTKDVLHLLLKKSMDLEMKVKVARSPCLLKNYAKDNYNEMLGTESYHCYREPHFYYMQIVGKGMVR